jgi:hypothetical protein
MVMVEATGRDALEAAGERLAGSTGLRLRERRQSGNSISTGS